MSQITTRLGILAHIYENFSRSEAIGLNCLIFLALHRDTTVLYQRQTMGFSEVPSQVIQWCDLLKSDDDLLKVAKQITLNLLEELVTDQQKGDRSQLSPNEYGLNS